MPEIYDVGSGAQVRLSARDKHGLAGISTTLPNAAWPDHPDDGNRCAVKVMGWAGSIRKYVIEADGFYYPITHELLLGCMDACDRPVTRMTRTRA